MHVHIIEYLNHLTQTNLVNLRTRIVVWHHLLEARILLADNLQSMVYHHTNLRVMGMARYILPTRILRHPEHMFGGIFVAVLLKALALSNEFVIAFLKTIADILQEHESQHHILILRSGEVATQFVSTVPYTVFDRLFLNYFRLFCHYIPIICFSNQLRWFYKRN